MNKFIKILILFLITTVSFGGIENAVENKVIEQQVQGEYPKLPRENLPHGTIQQAWSKSSKTDGIKHINYSPHERVVIATREFMTTEILLPSWEYVEEKHIVVGDSESFYVKVVASNLVSIQPLISGADTSLKILGNSGWLYSFYVVSHGSNSTQLPDLAVNIHVPGPKLVGIKGGFIKPVLISGNIATSDEEPDYLEKIDLNFTKLDFNYTMYGDQTIAPERVYATDVITVLDYGNKKLDSNEMPRVVAVIDGIDTPVNNMIKDRKILVWHKGILALQHGEKTTCIFPSNVAPKNKYKKK